MKKFLRFLQVLSTSICGISVAQFTIALSQGDLAEARVSFIIAVVTSIPLWVNLALLFRAIERDERRTSEDIRAIRVAAERTANAGRLASKTRSFR